MEALLVNAGSSSVKFRLVHGERTICEGTVERIGEHGSLIITRDGRTRTSFVHAEDYAVAGALILREIGTARPSRVVHRIVHGGPHERPVRITRQVIVELWELIPLAPLHLPPALQLIEYLHAHLHAEHWACFDTMFHRTMPAVMRNYAIPRELASQHRIERYGFHGLAHANMARQAAAITGKPLDGFNAITCQCGSGISLCAVRDGKSVATTMGFTPLEGVMMGTRSGSIDPAIIPFLVDTGMDPREVLRILEHESGLLAVGGKSDTRDLLEAERRGDARATLALDMLATQVRMQIGAYTALLGRVDAVVLAGGMMRAPALRIAFLQGLTHLGIVVGEEFWRPPPVQFGTGSVALVVVDVDELEEMRRLTA